jgi:hypothetical protein
VGGSGCGAGAVPSKQAKQTSKGLVFGAVAVRGAGVRVRAYLKARFRCLVKCGAVVLNG